MFPPGAAVLLPVISVPGVGQVVAVVAVIAIVAVAAIATADYLDRRSALQPVSNPTVGIGQQGAVIGTALAISATLVATSKADGKYARDKFRRMVGRSMTRAEEREIHLEIGRQTIGTSESRHRDLPKEVLEELI